MPQPPSDILAQTLLEKFETSSHPAAGDLDESQQQVRGIEFAIGHLAFQVGILKVPEHRRLNREESRQAVIIHLPGNDGHVAAQTLKIGDYQSAEQGIAILPGDAGAFLGMRRTLRRPRGRN